MNAIEKAYLEGYKDGDALGADCLAEDEWLESEAKRQADRYEGLIAGWKLRTERLYQDAQRAFEGGQQGEAFSIKTDALCHELLIQQLERIGNDKN